MIARLWWKEARQAWLIWMILAVAGLGVQGFAAWIGGFDADSSGYVQIALVVSLIYLFLIAAAAFAGERENGTLRLLDVMPVERWKVWLVKAGFALATATVLALLLWGGAGAFGGWSVNWQRGGVGIVVWGVLALGWGLFCSSLSSNPLAAAVLAMVLWSASLLFLVDLNQGITALESIPALLGVGLVAGGASVLAFVLDTPPKHSPARRRPAFTTAVEPGSASAAPMGFRRPRFWAYSLIHLGWQTLRQVRSNLWILLVVTMASFGLSGWLWWWSSGIVLNPGSHFPGAVLLAVLMGLAAFNDENRGGTTRFLLRQGVRPGQVWLVKVLIWWGAASVLWSLLLVRLWYDLSDMPFRWFHAMLSIGFATSVLCGMVFKRGIMAGTVTAISCCGLMALLGTAFLAKVLYPWHLPYVVVGLLAVSWAWSGDWLFNRPGWAKFARLGLYLGVASVALFLGYVAERDWLVPKLSEAEYQTILEPRRISASIPEEANAAPLYREVERLLTQHSRPTLKLKEEVAERSPASNSAYSDSEWDPTTPELAEWLVQTEPILELLRKAARMPGCQFDDLRTTTWIAVSTNMPHTSVTWPLVYSAKARLAQGDLEGAWTEIETIVRIGRQWSYLFTHWWVGYEQQGNSLALQWAADPRHTVETLEAGRRAWLAIPEPASKGDRFRIEALVFHNTLSLPGEELMDGLFFSSTEGRRKASASQWFEFSLQTTPWELSRARKVFDLTSASLIPVIERYPAEESFYFPSWNLVHLKKSEVPGLLSPMMANLTETTPLLQHSRLGWDLRAINRNEVARRAVGLVLQLRLWQASHDGALPHSLEELPNPLTEYQNAHGADAVIPDEIYEQRERDLLDREDPYAITTQQPFPRPFGYTRSYGQPLFPIGSEFLLQESFFDQELKRQEPTPDHWLLYSIGPDGVNEQAARNLNNRASGGDIVFPLKDGVKPPTSSAE